MPRRYAALGTDAGAPGHSTAASIQGLIVHWRWECGFCCPCTIGSTVCTFKVSILRFTENAIQGLCHLIHVSLSFRQTPVASLRLAGHSVGSTWAAPLPSLRACSNPGWSRECCLSVQIRRDDACKEGEETSHRRREPMEDGMLMMATCQALYAVAHARERLKISISVSRKGAAGGRISRLMLPGFSELSRSTPLLIDVGPMWYSELYADHFMNRK